MRILKVVVLLLALGATAGAIVGTLVFFGTLLFNGGLREGNAQLYGYAAAFGAAVGALSGPPIALLFLRRVPLWRATAETAAVAALGAVLGGLIRVPFGWAYGATVLALADALRLRHVYRATKATAATSIDES